MNISQTRHTPSPFALEAFCYGSGVPSGAYSMGTI